jgi:hypothetical protein
MTALVPPQPCHEYKCLDIISTLDYIKFDHMFRHDNSTASELALISLSLPCQSRHILNIKEDACCYWLRCRRPSYAQLIWRLRPMIRDLEKVGVKLERIHYCLSAGSKSKERHDISPNIRVSLLPMNLGQWFGANTFLFMRVCYTPFFGEKLESHYQGGLCF